MKLKDNTVESCASSDWLCWQPEKSVEDVVHMHQV